MSSAPESEELFQEDEFPFTVLQNFKDFKDQDQLCDVELLVGGGGRVFRAHRLVLAAASPYFRAMFTTDMVEAKKKQISLPEMDVGAFEELLNFAYSGEVLMSLGSVQSLMGAASFLQMETVVGFGAEFLQARLRVGNVLGIRELADTYKCSTLMEATDRFIDKHFVLLSKTDDFRCLSQGDLTRILSKDGLFVSSEEQVFEALMCWVQAEPGVRADQLPTLLLSVRLPLLAPEFLDDCVQAHRLIKDSHPCLKLLNDAKEYKLMPSGHPLLQTFQTKARCCRDAPQLIYVVGGDDVESDALNSVLMYDPLVDRWSQIHHLTTPRSYLAAAVLDGLVYAIGGHNDSGRMPLVEAFDPRSGRSEEVASLSENRDGVCAAVVDNRLFVCGGRDGIRGHGQHFSSVVVLEGGQWTATSPMLHRRYASAVAVLEGKIYMIGGSDERGESVNTVERLDVETMEWSMVRPMRKARTYPGACALNGRLFVCGGYHSCRSVEMYDPSKDEWVKLPSMIERRYSLVLAPSCGSIYAIGGHNCGTTVASMEVFDPEEGVWRMGASLDAPRRGASVVVVPIRPEDLKT